MIQGDTRFWPNVTSSLIDHCPRKIICAKNHSIALSDHNLLEIHIRIEGIEDTPKEYIARNFSKFDIKNYQNEMSSIDWTSLLEENNLNLDTNIYEEKIKSVLDKMALMKISQVKKSNKKWIKKFTRDEMKARDSARVTAKTTQSKKNYTIQ